MEPPSTETATTDRPAMRRTVAVVITSALIGALVGGGVVFLSMAKPSAPTKPPVSASKAPTRPSAPTTGSKEAAAGSEWSSPLTSAKQLVAAGKLREAQEEYLSILLIEPTHEEAMRGLVRVVGLIAKGDRAALQRQAEDYRQAVALGIETEEHYTAPAMELLARASLQAAGVRAVAVQPRPQPAPAPAPSNRARPPAPSRPETKPQPRPVAPTKPAPPPAPTTQAPPAQPAPPTQTAPAPPAAAPVNVNEPFVTVVIGPVGSSDRASAITGELTIAGYAARLRRQAAGSYVITLGPYRQSEAARAAGYVRSRFGASIPVALSPVP